ncbi:STM4504/CBY_0614 family protein [Nostoc sp.]|uniref:STM4504/CBY_0614 family protein n=1 Tax=Nostoc sp. TaxID=1180 RepID=UPI002FF61DC2
MKVYDIYSKRQKRLMGEFPDIYQYDDIPRQLRIQIVHIMNDAIGAYSNHKETANIFQVIHDILCREYGMLSFEGIFSDGYKADVINFMLGSNDTKQVIDVVELSFQLIYITYRLDNIRYYTAPKITLENAIEELNFRFTEHGVGYQYESGEIIRVDSQIIHAEAVKPVLLLLSDTRFKGANEEFLKAHEHYRHGRYKECLVDCLKAFESTMKTICDIQGWSYQPTDTVKKLIDICFQNNLIPTYLQNQFTSLKSNLESGIPTVRNKNGGHGQGSQPITVPQYFAAYQLHITASTILFLLEAEKSLP